MWLAAVLLVAMYVPDDTAEGMKALEEQRYDAAITSFTKVATADPKDYSAYFHIALAQSLLNRDPEAIASYRKVLELKPGLYEAQLNLGNRSASKQTGKRGGSAFGRSRQAETQGIPSCLLCG